MSTLQFWFDRFLSLIAAFADPRNFNAHESELWSGTIATYRALKQSIEQLCQPRLASDKISADSASQVLATLVASRAEANERALKQSMNDYGRDRLRLNGLVEDVLSTKEAQ